MRCNQHVWPAAAGRDYAQRAHSSRLFLAAVLTTVLNLPLSRIDALPYPAVTEKVKSLSVTPLDKFTIILVYFKRFETPEEIKPLFCFLKNISSVFCHFKPEKMIVSKIF